MNIEFLAIIVGSGVAIVLLAVLAELFALRSSVNRSAAAVKDLMTEAHEHEAAAHAAVPGAAEANAIPPEEPSDGSAAAVTPSAPQALMIGTATASPSQLALALPERATKPAAAARPMPQAKSMREEAAPAAVTRPTAASPPPTANTEKPAAPKKVSRPVSEEERGARRARRQERRKLGAADASDNAAELATASAPKGQPGKSDEEIAARRERRLSRLIGKQEAVARRPNETDEAFAARRERVLDRRKRRQSDEGAAE